MRGGLLGSYLEGLGCLATTLLGELGGPRDLSMADGLVILVDDMKLNEFHMPGGHSITKHTGGGGLKV